MREPPRFWADPAPDVRARALAPLAAAYGAVWRLREALARPVRVSVPLVCVGNPTLGGAGKTPAALAVADRLAQLGATPHFLSKGYGGTLKGPLTVDPARHRASEVGDEPLLLAAAAPTHIARSRARGGAFAAAAGAGVIVMDDGFQNPSLAKDLALLVIDAAAGLGNGMVFPAGPLRAPLAAQLARAHAVVLVGEGAPGERLARLVEGAGQVLLRARLQPVPAASDLAGRRVVAFAGIGRPSKFYASLGAVGAEVAATRDFPDHHSYGPGDIAELEALAARHGEARLVTTEKDLTRFDDRSDPGAAFRSRLSVLPVRLEFQDWGEVDRLLSPLLPPVSADSSV